MSFRDVTFDDSDDGSVTLRPSGLWRWQQCEKRALAEIRMPVVDDRPHIAAWVGTEVHARVANPDHQVSDAGMAVYDKRTPTQNFANKQVKEIAESVTDALEMARIEIVAQEREMGLATPFDAYPWLHMTGTVDVVGLHDTYTVLLDIKTGDQLDHAWLQLGAYALLMDDIDMKPDRAIILHAPRSKWDPMGGGVTVSLHDLTPKRGDVDLLMDETLSHMSRVGAIIASETEPVARAGHHCASCPVREGCLARSLTAKEK